MFHFLYTRYSMKRPKLFRTKMAAPCCKCFFYYNCCFIVCFLSREAHHIRSPSRHSRRHPHHHLVSLVFTFYTDTDMSLVRVPSTHVLYIFYNRTCSWSVYQARTLYIFLQSDMFLVRVPSTHVLYIFLQYYTLFF